MINNFTFVVGVFATTYVFLRLLLHLTQDAREPPAILTTLPFVSPLLGMIREKTRFHVRLNKQYGLPIYTLRLPFQRIYVVNSTELIPLLQRQWKTVSFAAIAADAGTAVGMSKDAVKLMHQDLTSEHGFSLSWPRYIMPALSPGQELDEMNRRSLKVHADELKKLVKTATAKVGLSRWSRDAMVTSTTEAVWGAENPYRDPSVAEAWRVFEASFLTFAMFPMASIFFPHLLRARETVVAAMMQYVRKGGLKSASGLVRMRHEHHQGRFGLGDDDIARGELGNTFAVLSSTTPCALWLIYHIFSDERVLADVRVELSNLIHEECEDGQTVRSVDLGALRTSCPILLSTFQETMRFRFVSPGPRVLLEDVQLGSHLLKKGSMLLIPTMVQHRDIEAWGNDATEFDHMRFARKPTTGRKTYNRVAFRAFGGGHILCPGRHFASTEIMAFAAMLALQFDVIPVEGRWVEPCCDNSPALAGFPIPDKDIEVELRCRDTGADWNFTFSGSNRSMDIVAEDSISTNELSG